MAGDNGNDEPTPTQKAALGKLETNLQKVVDETNHSGTERMRAAFVLFIVEIKGDNGLDAKELKLVQHLVTGQKLKEEDSLWDKFVDTLKWIVSSVASR